MVPRRHRVRCVIIYRKDKGSQALVFTLPIKCSKHQRSALLMASAPGCLAFGKAYKTAENFRCLVKIWKKVLRFYTKFCIIMFKEKDKKLQRK